MRFHILGTGAVGCFVASQLVRQHNVTLLLRSQAHLSEFKNRKKSITYIRADQGTGTVDGFETQLGNQCTAPIENLIVTTKAHHVVEAVRPLVHCLTEKSTVLLLQNGMGIADELRESLFSKTAPQLLVGVNRHGIERLSPFSIAHHFGWNTPGSFLLGALDTNRSLDNVTRRVLNALADIPELGATILPWQELHKHMLGKLVVNMTINPLGALFSCRNGILKDSPAAMDLIHRICEEAALVLPGNKSSSELVALVMQMMIDTSGNKNSMLQDIEAGRSTEIDYINGYLCRLANDKGVPVPVNEMLVQMIHGKEQIPTDTTLTL